MTVDIADWFLQNRRSLPWRDRPTPYQVWVSEVMLQQTQVSVVIPYYLRWMERFPTPFALAKAPIEEVVKLWEGLGYYSRARNLHAGAKMVVVQYGGVVPGTVEELQKIQGIGPYTVGAILCFAFGKKAAAVDGNVMRVISRLYGVEGDISLSSTKKVIEQHVLKLLPEHTPQHVAEGLIELGATVCTKRPSCDICPLTTDCVAFKTGQQSAFPVKAAKIQYEKVERTVAVPFAEGHLLLRQVPKGAVMADLWQFPYLDGVHSVDELMEQLGLDGILEESLDHVRHTFTRYRVSLHPYLIHCKEVTHDTEAEWVPLDEVKKLPFSSGHRRILQKFWKRIPYISDPSKICNYVDY